VTEPMGPIIHPVWGAPPQPILEKETQRSSLNGSLLVVVIMFGWLLVVYGMGVLVARNDPNVEVPVTVNLGVVVTPADGWYSAEDEWDVGDTGVALQKSGAYVAFWVEEYAGTNDELMRQVLAELETGFDSFRALPARAVTVAGDLPALMVYFSGISEWGHEEDEVAALSYRGISVVMLAEAQTGQLAWVQEDLNRMLATLQVPR
jgi:hypothetical protein